ncbi:glucose dehydrogenase [FAD, quinone]-like isoform X2 [Leptopilina heterotoma]|uniref:glucose dehydrogenase [FAD, quinone]-like isoform X2 n=1 Tax=Leptopilina heterotoma TaxID=63436 RepID=UPI001CA8CC3C|nr:glucose dehydrogenase [FAD, quinone]-like isoform X2 [Leptopilina heterotoma]
MWPVYLQKTRMSYQLSSIPHCSDPFLGPTLAQGCPGSQFVLFMTLLDTFIRGKREVSQLCERIIPTNPAENYYDFIVIGGGSAGSVVASRLSEIPEWKVLLLEAGPDEPPGTSIPSMVGMFLGSDIDWQYNTTNEKFACLSTDGSCSWPRGKNLGGTSSHNGMMYIRGHPQDFNNWETLGNKGWSWKEVLPYFMCMENNTELHRVGTKYHSAGGPLNVERFSWQPPITNDILKAAEEVGYKLIEDLNGDDVSGFTIAQTNSKNGVRVSSAAAFLRPIRNRRNLHIMLNATVARLIIEDSKAVGVQYYKDGEYRAARVTKEIVVSAGAVNSPQILLLSGIGPAEHLKSVNVQLVKDLPGVGENLHNHVSYTISWSINQRDEYYLNWAAVTEYVSDQKGIMSSTGLAQITGIVPSRYTTNDHPDIQFFFGGYQASCAASGEVGSLMSNDLRRISASPTHLQPRSRGRLRLASNNPFVHPIITANYLQDPQDRAIMVEGILKVMSLSQTNALRKYNLQLVNRPIRACSMYAFLTPEYWDCAIRQDTGPENHQAGSCKMGPPSDPQAVVDPELKVYGIKGLRIADASIMPQVTSGNTAAPSMMIGERVAAFIKKDWNVPPTLCSTSINENSLDLLLWGIRYLDVNQNIWRR